MPEIRLWRSLAINAKTGDRIAAGAAPAAKSAGDRMKIAAILCAAMLALPAAADPFENFGTAMK